MNEDDEPNPLPMIAAVTLSSSAILAALVQSLHDKGVLDGEETVEPSTPPRSRTNAKL